MEEPCRLCGHQLKYVFSQKVLGKYEVKYFVCNNCELLQTEKPYWLQEAYPSVIRSADTGIFLRNITFCKIASVFLYFLFQREGKFIDYGGGHGIFTRLIRDVGFDFYLFDKYADNLYATSFKAVKSKTYIGATALEVFEHLDDPLGTLEDILGYLKSKNLLFTTDLYGEHIPNPNDWSYYAFNMGQHISFYNIKTLRWIAKKFNLHFWSNGRSLHCFTEEKIPHWKLDLLYRFNKTFFTFVNKAMSSRTMLDYKMCYENFIK